MVELAVVVGLVIATSAACSLFEAVLYSVPASRIDTLEREGRGSGRLLRRLRTEVDRPIAAILSLNTLANTGGAALRILYSYLQARLTWKWRKKLTDHVHDAYFQNNHDLPSWEASIDAGQLARGVQILAHGDGKKFDPAAGVAGLCKVGTQMKQGEPLMIIHYNDEKRLNLAMDYFKASYRLAPKRPNPAPLVVERVA